MARKILMKDQAVPVADNQNTLTSRQRGRALIQDFRLIEKQEMTL